MVRKCERVWQMIYNVVSGTFKEVKFKMGCERKETVMWILSKKDSKLKEPKESMELVLSKSKM